MPWPLISDAQWRIGIMATILESPSRTFGEYLLLPDLTTESCVPGNVDLTTPLVRHRKGTSPALSLRVPFTSAIMQSVSGDRMAVALAREGGMSFIFCSQPIEAQAGMIAKVKKYKAGFVVSDANVSPATRLEEVLKLREKTGHSTMAVTDNGQPNGKFHGLITSQDYLRGTVAGNAEVQSFMTGFDQIVYAKEGISMKEANEVIRSHKINVLPILDANLNLAFLVFRKDYDEHVSNPNELLDAGKRLRVGGGVNTRDYKERIPELVNAGVDILCIDASDGFSVWQKQVIGFVRSRYGDTVKIGAGNVVDGIGFEYLAQAGADFVKVGIGGGAICITREEKGIGRGQASALIDVAKARDKYFAETGEYVPICSDGGIVHDYHMIIALALGADFLMMGRYFSRFDESPAPLVKVGSTHYKEYWGEGSNRARNWQRYDYLERSSDQLGLMFEEGIDAHVPYAGKLKDNLGITIAKLKSTMCNCGAVRLPEFYQGARLTVVSALTLRESGTNDVLKKIDPW
jgi:IMP dehydrogenase